MAQRPRIVVVMPTTSYRADAFLDAAARAGADALVASDRCHVLDGVFEWPKESLVIDFYDLDASVATIVAAAQQPGAPVKAVVAAGGEAAAVLANRAARALGLAANPEGAEDAASNKRVLRERLDAGGVRQPRWFVIEAGESATTAFARARATLGMPCVLKPLLLSGSRGVLRADDEASFGAALERIRRILALPAVREQDPHESQRVLCEAFVAGVEVSLEALLDAGELHALALFDKPDPLDGPTFEETLYVTPSRLAHAVQAAVREETAKAARAMGLRTGPVHAELRIAPDGPTVIEVAARTIGGLCARTLRFGTGLALEELVVRHALGEPVTSLARERAAAGVMMLPIPAAGVLQAVDGVDAATAESSGGAAIEDVVISARIGEELVPLPEGASYLGFLFARGGDPAAVEATLRAAHKHLHFRIARTLPVR